MVYTVWLGISIKNKKEKVHLTLLKLEMDSSSNKDGQVH